MTNRESFVTHEVENQPSPVPADNAWTSDRALREGVEREGGAWAADHLARNSMGSPGPGGVVQ